MVDAQYRCMAVLRGALPTVCLQLLNHYQFLKHANFLPTAKQVHLMVKKSAALIDTSTSDAAYEQQRHNAFTVLNGISPVEQKG